MNHVLICHLLSHFKVLILHKYIFIQNNKLLFITISSLPASPLIWIS